MLIDNKYQRYYNNIIEKSRKESREYDPSVHEWHHVVPRCLGGKEVIALTFKEHYVCHHLLTKFTSGKARAQMMIAFFTFFVFDSSSCGQSKRPKMTPSLYEKHKIGFAAACSELSKRPVDKSIYSFKNKKTKEIFTGTIFDFKKHSGLTHQEVYNLKSKIGTGTSFHSKNWGIYDDTKKQYTCDIPRVPVYQDKITCHRCGYSATRGNFNRWHGLKIPCVF